MTLSPPPTDTVPMRNAEPRTSAMCSVSPLIGAAADAVARRPMIRSFFLEPQTTYTFTDLALLWQVPVDVVQDIYEDRYSLDFADADPAQARVPWEDAADTATTFNLLRPYEVERALDAEFLPVRSDQWKTLPLLIRLPQFVLQAVAARPSLCSDASASVRVEHFLLEVLFEQVRCRF